MKYLFVALTVFFALLSILMIVPFVFVDTLTKLQITIMLGTAMVSIYLSSTFEKILTVWCE